MGKITPPDSRRVKTPLTEMALDGRAGGLRCLWDEHDVVSQVAQALDQLGRGALAGDLVEATLAEVAEGFARAQYVERSKEQLVRDGHDRPHRATAGTQTVILVSVVAALGPHRGRSCGEQRGFEEHVAPARPGMGTNRGTSHRAAPTHV